MRFIRQTGSKIKRSQRVEFSFNGATYSGHMGESVAVALAANGIITTRIIHDGSARGAFCFMGSCQECILLVNGLRVEACQAVLVEGLTVQSIGSINGAPTSKGGKNA
ncbi:MAG: (2Fe-2S)-binding protein [Rhizobiales bacterium]|nr:(2Fe-2S)-binding protein [Hyphomicrobiales bacterium]